MKSASFRRTLVPAALLLAACVPAFGDAPAAPTGAGAPALSDAELRGRVSALFRRGMAAVAASQRAASEDEREARLDEAIAAFHAILVRQPGLVRVRLELARAFFFKGEDRLSRRLFESVLAGNPPRPVVANIRQFLGAMRARRRWTANFGAALVPDSNLNSASSERTILLDTPFGRLPFQRDADSVPESGIGLSVWGGGEYQHPLGSRWRLRAGANVVRREYRSGDFDRTTVATHLGPRWLAGPDERVQPARHGAAGLDSGADPQTDRLGVRLETVQIPGAPVAGAWRRRAGPRRDCRNCDWLDGPVVAASLNTDWALTPVVRMDAGADWQRARADVESWRSTALGVPISGRRSPCPGASPSGSGATVRRTEYDGTGLGPPHDRPRASRRPRPEPLRLGVQPRLHRCRLQPARHRPPPKAPDQRPGARLQPDLGRAQLRASVLTPLRRCIPPSRVGRRIRESAHGQPRRAVAAGTRREGRSPGSAAEPERPVPPGERRVSTGRCAAPGGVPEPRRCREDASRMCRLSPAAARVATARPPKRGATPVVGRAESRYIGGVE